MTFGDLTDQDRLMLTVGVDFAFAKLTVGSVNCLGRRQFVKLGPLAAHQQLASIFLWPVATSRALETRIFYGATTQRAIAKCEILKNQTKIELELTYLMRSG